MDSRAPRKPSRVPLAGVAIRRFASILLAIASVGCGSDDAMPSSPADDAGAGLRADNYPRIVLPAMGTYETVLSSGDQLDYRIRVVLGGANYQATLKMFEDQIGARSGEILHGETCDGLLDPSNDQAHTPGSLIRAMLDDTLVENGQKAAVYESVLLIIECG